MIENLKFVFDPDNNIIYLLIRDDDPYPVTLSEAMALSISLAQAIREAVNHASRSHN